MLQKTVASSSHTKQSKNKNKNKTSEMVSINRGHLLLVSILCALAPIAPFAVALLTQEWYVVQSLTNSFKFGLSDMCTLVPTASGGSTVLCGATDYTALAAYTSPSSLPACGDHKSADDAKGRLDLIQGLVIAAIIGCPLSAGGAIAAWAARLFHPLVRLCLCVLFIATLGVAVAACVLFPITAESWLFCGTTYCSAVAGPNGECTNYFGYGFALLCCGAGMLLVAAAVMIAAAVYSWPEARAVERRARQAPKAMDGDPWAEARTINVSPPAAPPIAAAAPPPAPAPAPVVYPSEGAEPEKAAEEPKDAGPHIVVAARTMRRRHPNEPPLPLELQDGDWAYDPSHGYFWSEDAGLYFEPDTQQFYDPRSDAWFNPETEMWFRPRGDASESRS